MKLITLAEITYNYLLNKCQDLNNILPIFAISDIFYLFIFFNN